MAGATLTTMNAALKNQYIGPIRKQFNEACILLSRVEKDDQSVVGKNFTVPVHYGRNESVSSRAEGAALAAAGQQTYKDMIIPMKHQYGRIQLSGQTIRATATDQGAFVRAVESEMKGVLANLRSDVNRQLFGDGTGSIATCASASTVNVTVDSTAKLRVGQRVDILVKATGATSYGVVGTTVVSITSATVFVVADAPSTPGSIDNTFGVYISGNRANEMMGLGGIFSATDTLQGLDVATYPFWKANILANGGSGRAISEALMQQAMDTTEVNSDGKVSAIYTSYGVRRAYMALLQKQKLYANVLDLKGGFKALDYNGLPLIPDKDCPTGKLFFTDESKLKILRLADISWMEEDGNVLSKVSGYDAYEAVLFSYMELGCMARNAQTLLSDVTES